MQMMVSLFVIIKFNPSWYVFLFFTLFSILLTLSANNWFLFWMSFEISVLSFLPMISSISPFSVEMMVKYYIIQAIGSYTYLISNIIILGSKIMLVSFTFSITMKLGLFPFMYWVPMIMSKITWTACFFVSTIQKMNPMIVLLTLGNNYIIMISTTLSIFISGFMASNQTDLRSLMAYSSISHSSFMVIGGFFSCFLFFMYMMTYMCLTWVMFNKFNSMKLFIISSWKMISTSKKTNLLILTLSGLPPFPFFFLKMMVYFFMLSNPVYLILILLGSLLSMYFYMLMVVPALMK